MARNLGLHHIAKRKQGFFARLRLVDWVARLDHLMFAVAFIYPLALVPQIVRLMTTQDASSFSLLSFGLKVFFALPWIAYGYVHKNRPIFYSNLLWFLGYTVVLVQIIVY